MSDNIRCYLCNGQAIKVSEFEWDCIECGYKIIKSK